MIGEAILAIKALDSAFVMVQGAIAKKERSRGHGRGSGPFLYG